MKEIYFAGGCFWGLEKFFSLVNGVVNTSVGYANGNTENPTYQEVYTDGTGYAETVKVVYDEKVISLAQLLELFFSVIDPTSLNKQGGDIGTRYRTGIYYTDPKDNETILASLKEEQKKYADKIVVEAESLKKYYLAEEYHQEYLEKNPQGYCHLGQFHFKKAKEFNKN